MSGEAELTTLGVVASIAIPLALAMLMTFLLVQLLIPSSRLLHVSLGIGNVVVIVLALVLASLNAPLWACLAVLILAPWSWVLGYELLGHRHVQEGLDEMAAAR